MKHAHETDESTPYEDRINLVNVGRHLSITRVVR